MSGKSFSLLALFLLAVNVLVGCDEDSSVAAPSGSEANAFTRLTAVGECQQTVLADVQEPELTVTVNGGTLAFVHERAMFNCCIDSLSLAMAVEGGKIVVTEYDHCSQPCLCVCPRDVEGEVVDLSPGTYTLAVCDTSGATLCEQPGIVID